LIDREILTSKQISRLKTLFEIFVEQVLFFFSKVGGHIVNGFSSKSGVGLSLVLGSGRERSLGRERGSWSERGLGSALEGFPWCGAVYYIVSLFPAIEALSFCNEPGTFFWGEPSDCDTRGCDLSPTSLDGLPVFPLLFLEVS
jgi:hypothetical protein